MSLEANCWRDDNAWGDHNMTNVQSRVGGIAGLVAWNSYQNNMFSPGWLWSCKSSFRTLLMRTETKTFENMGWHIKDLIYFKYSVSKWMYLLFRKASGSQSACSRQPGLPQMTAIDSEMSFKDKQWKWLKYVIIY